MSKTWTVSYMVRERKGDYLTAVEELEASHDQLVAALELAVDRLEDLKVNHHAAELRQSIANGLRAALKAAGEEV